jgi:putative acetyltransferase
MLLLCFLIFKIFLYCNKYTLFLRGCQSAQMQNLAFEIRNIRKQDDYRLAEIIRATLAEFRANKPGTVYYDASTDHLSEVFKKERSTYFVACADKEIIGGAGVYPSAGLPSDTCELVKMYLLPQARGKGLGYELLSRCERFAHETGYRKLYLETMPELNMAITLYEKFGFERLSAPLGNTGHTGCDIWMIKAIR